MLTVNIMIIYKITNKINQKIYKCKIFDLVLEKYIEVVQFVNLENNENSRRNS